MAKTISGKLEGMREFKSSLDRYAKLIEKDVYVSLEGAANDIASEARSLCTIPSIASGVSMQKVENRFIVTTSGVESAYLEFGTGNYAKALLGPYPKDWVDMARTFFINGMGRTPAKPYLYPAYQRNAGEAIIQIADKIEGH